MREVGSREGVREGGGGSERVRGREGARLGIGVIVIRENESFEETGHLVL